MADLLFAKKNERQWSISLLTVEEQLNLGSVARERGLVLKKKYPLHVNSWLDTSKEKRFSSNIKVAPVLQCILTDCDNCFFRSQGQLSRLNQIPALISVWTGHTATSNKLLLLYKTGHMEQGTNFTREPYFLQALMQSRQSSMASTQWSHLQI